MENTIRSISQLFAAISQFFRSNILHMLQLIFMNHPLFLDFATRFSLTLPFLWIIPFCNKIFVESSLFFCPQAASRKVHLETELAFWAWCEEAFSWKCGGHDWEMNTNTPPKWLVSIKHISICSCKPFHALYWYHTCKYRFVSQTWYPKINANTEQLREAGLFPVPSMFSSPQSHLCKRWSFELNLKIQPSAN